MAVNPELQGLLQAGEEAAPTPEQERALSPYGVVSGGLRAGILGTGSAAAETLGFGDAADKLSRMAAEGVDPTLQDYRNVTDAGSLGRYVLAQGSQALGSTIPTLIPGLGGAGVAGRVALGLRAGTRAAQVARTVGGAVGGYGAALPIEMGETLQEAKRLGMDTTEEGVRQVAWDKALVNAGLEAVMPAMLGGKLVKGFLPKVLSTGFTEGATEGAQEISGLFAKSKLTGQPVDFQDPNVRAQLVNAIVGGAVGGGGIGIPIGALESVADTKFPTLPSLSKTRDATTQLFKDATGKALESTADLYKSAKSYVTEAAGLAPGEASPHKAVYDEILGQAQAAAAQGGNAFAEFRDQVNQKYGAADRETREAVAQALLRGSLGNLYDDLSAQAQAALAQGKEAVVALNEKYKDARPDIKDALAQALASGAPRSVAGSAAQLVANITGALKQVTDPEQRAVLLDNAAAQLGAMRNRATDWAKGLAAIVTNEANIVENPRQQTDVFGEAPNRIAAFLSGADWFPRSIVDEETANKYMLTPEGRTRVAQAVYESLPAEYRARIQNPVFNDGVTQATIGGLYAEHAARSRIERVREIIDSLKAKAGDQAPRSEALTQADLNLAAGIEDRLRAAMTGHMITAMEGKGGTKKRAARAVKGMQQRVEETGKSMPKRMEEVEVEDAEGNVTTEKVLSEATLGDLAKQYALGLREAFTIQTPEGRATAPNELVTDEVVALYQDLADVFDNHEPAMEVLEEAKRVYGSNIDLDSIHTIGISDRDLVQEYALVQLDERQASRIAHAIEMFLAGVPMRDPEALRLVNVAFGGQPQRFADVASRIAANHRNQPGAYGSRAAEAFARPGEAIEEEEVTQESAEEAMQRDRDLGIEGLTGSGERTAEGYQEEAPEARVSFGYSRALMTADKPAEIEKIVSRLREQFPGDVDVQAVPLSQMSEEDTSGEDVLDYITSFLEQSTDKRAARQLAEISEVADDPEILADVLRNYVFFRFGERTGDEELTARQFANIKSQGNDKGSAEQGTLSFADGKTRQVFSAVALVNTMIHKKGVGTAETLPQNIQRAFSAGLGALIGRINPDALVGLRNPQKIEVGRPMPTPFAPTRPRDDMSERTRPDAALLLSNIKVGGSDKTMVQRVLDWAASKVELSKFDKNRGTRIPDASITFNFAGKDYTLDVSSSFMQIREGEKVVAGPVIRPDLLIYSPREGDKLTWGEVQVTPEPAKLAEYMSKKAKDRARDQLTGQIDRRLANVQKRLVADKSDANAKRLLGILQGLKNKKEPLDILDDMSGLSFEELEMHPLYSIYESILEDIGPSVANAAWRDYQRQEKFTYESGETISETEIVEGEEGPQAVPVEGPRRVTTKKKSPGLNPFEPGISEEEFKSRLSQRAIDLLGGEMESRERAAEAPRRVVRSTDPADWPADVRERVFEIMQPAFASAKQKGVGPKTIQQFARDMLSQEQFADTDAVKQANKYLERYYGAVEKAQEREARVPSERRGRGTAASGAARGRVRETEMESIGFARKAAQKQEAKPRQFDEFGTRPDQPLAGTGEGAGAAEFGADVIPEGVRGTREPTTAMRAMKRAWRFMDSKDEKDRALMARLKKAFAHPGLNQSMKQDLIRTLNREIADNPEAVTAKLNELSARIQKEARREPKGGAPEEPGKP